jgi:hypothetical protein
MTEYFGTPKYDPDAADPKAEAEADAAALSIARHAPIDEADGSQPEAEPEPEQTAAPVEAPPAAEPEPVAEPTPEAEQPEGDPALILGKYKDQDALVDAHGNLQTAYGQQSTELGKLRESQLRLEGKLEALSQPAPVVDQPPPQPQTGKPPQPQMPGQDQLWSDPRMQAALSHKTQAYLAVGYGQEDAQRLAEADIHAYTFAGEAVAERANAPLNKQAELLQKNARLQHAAGGLKAEVDPEGRPLRSDWDEITETPEFEVVVHEMGESIYETGPDDRPVGLETAYLRTRFNVGNRLQATASSATAIATANAERDKVAAGAIPASPGARVSTTISEDDQDILDIYEAAKGTTKDGEPRPYFLGGGIRE